MNECFIANGYRYCNAGNGYQKQLESTGWIPAFVLLLVVILILTNLKRK